MEELKAVREMLKRFIDDMSLLEGDKIMLKEGGEHYELVYDGENINMFCMDTYSVTCAIPYTSPLSATKEHLFFIDNMDEIKNLFEKETRSSKRFLNALLDKLEERIVSK